MKRVNQVKLLMLWQFEINNC